MKEPIVSAYDQRPRFYKDVNKSDWEDWRWQQKNSVISLSQLKKVFPNLPSRHKEFVDKWDEKSFRFRITPYILSLIKLDDQDVPLADDPIWKQFFPEFEELLRSDTPRPDEYSAEKENWENKAEMLSPICQWKYTNRVIIYSIDHCFMYCTYCLRSLQSEAPEEKHGGIAHWDDTMAAINANPQIEEVILSGGDPLMYPNNRIEKMLKDIRKIPHVKSIRINTRTLTHNPYRIDEELCSLMKQYHVVKLGVHILHPNEISQEFVTAVHHIRKIAWLTMPMSQTVLIKGVNNNVDVLKQLFMSVYVLGIKPYYLLHTMPNIPAALTQRTSVQEGVRLMKQIKRHVSNSGVPEYIIVHRSGKHTVPLEIEGTPEFQYTKNSEGVPVVRFKNWKGNWEEYLDGSDEKAVSPKTIRKTAIPKAKLNMIPSVSIPSCSS